MADGSDGGEAEGASEGEGDEAGSDGGDANLDELEEAAEALLHK